MSSSSRPILHLEGHNFSVILLTPNSGVGGRQLPADCAAAATRQGHCGCNLNQGSSVARSGRRPHLRHARANECFSRRVYPPLVRVDANAGKPGIRTGAAHFARKVSSDPNFFYESSTATEPAPDSLRLLRSSRTIRPSRLSATHNVMSRRIFRRDPQVRAESWWVVGRRPRVSVRIFYPPNHQVAPVR